MNYSIAIFLINKDVRAIKCTYEDGKDQTLFKTMDPNIKVDDLVVVETNTRHGMTVCKVIEVDIDLDFDMTKQVDWIVEAVNHEQHRDLVQQEQIAISKMQAAERRKRRAAMADALLADHDAEIRTLAIANMNGDTPAEPPAAPEFSTNPRTQGRTD